MRGTPINLRQAITNALHDIEGDSVTQEHVEMAVGHVVDFLAQKFSVARIKASQAPLTDKDLMELWDKCT